jgi:CCR4-NOT transcription complex subunit 3
MAGARKLQGEIDKALKKVEEGLQVFDDLQETLEACETPSMKMKLEEDLKKELKKLQKLRDSVKGWAGSSEVKDKTKLLETRRNIEERMEKFKVIERESKMKAYSKEGLMRDTPLTPEDRRRMKTTEWMQKLVDEFNDELEAFEKDQEALEEAGGGKKKGGPTGEKTPEELLASKLRSHSFHVEKLEELIKAVENGVADCDEVDSLRGAFVPAFPFQYSYPHFLPHAWSPLTFCFQPHLPYTPPLFFSCFHCRDPGVLPRGGA